MLGLALLAVTGLAALAYLYLGHVYSYWRRKGLPQAAPVWVFGNLLDAFLMRRNPGQIYSDIYRMFSEHSAVGIYDCIDPNILVRSPDLIQRVLVSDFSSFHDNGFFVSKEDDPYMHEDPFCLTGDEWKASRSKIVSTMTTVRMKEVFPLMMEAIPKLNAYVDSFIGQDIKVRDLTGLFMMDNVSNVVFGIESNCFSDSEAAFRKVADILMKKQLQSWWRTIVFLCLPKVRQLLRLKFIPDAVINYMKNLVQQVYQVRKEKNVKRNDLFQYFMSKEKGDDIEELMYYSMLFFIEGFETSSMTASGVIYELALNPEVQQTLYEEVSSVKDLDWDGINHMQYLDKVVKESMRKYPVMYNMNKICTKPVTLDVDGKTVGIEPGTGVVVPVFALHRDPQYYPDPERFDPDRFSEDNISARPSYTYLPFGEGPRICPGMRFGLTQVKLLVAHLVLRYRLLRTDRTPASLTFLSTSFLVVPKEGEWINLEKRA